MSDQHDHPPPIPNPTTHHVHETAPMHDPVDQWHDHHADEMPQHAHAEVQNSRLVLFTGVALAAVIGVSVLVVYGFYVHYNTGRMSGREHVTEKDASPAPFIVTRREKAEDLSRLAAGGQIEIKVPAEKEGEFTTKQVTIEPAAQAMDAVVKRYLNQKVAQGN